MVLAAEGRRRGANDHAWRQGFPARGHMRRRGQISTQAHMTAGWVIAESDEPTTKPEKRGTEDQAEEGCVAATVRHISEGKLLV